MILTHFLALFAVGPGSAVTLVPAAGTLALLGSQAPLAGGLADPGQHPRLRVRAGPAPLPVRRS